MTGAAEMEFGFADMFRAMLKHWVLIVVVGVVCGVLGGAFAYLRSSGGQTQEVDASAYEEELANYEKNIELGSRATESTKENLIKLKEEWLAVSDLYKEHPLLQLDVSDCEWESVTIHFGNDTGAHKGMVFDWIGNADDAGLFGSAADKLSKYKHDIIITNDYACDTQLVLMGVEGWDIGAAASYLKDYLKSQAASDHVEIAAVTSSHGSGFNADASKFQVDMAYRVNALQNYITTVANSSTAFYVAGAPAAQETGVSKKTLLKFGIVGFIAGLIIAAAFVVIRAVRQGRITSRRQVEGVFGLELLSDLRKDEKTSLAILDANLDVMVGADAVVMMIDSSGASDFSERVSAWGNGVDHKLLTGRDVYEDSETIEALNEASGIVISIREDVSRLSDVQRLMLRMAKLDKPVLGYVEM
ncbi:MAG: hypothetical protein IJS24_03880 [Eubacterium sp.]|nr:hypothetical protein [Eubacterium sp.]